MKKVFALALAVLMVLSLAACSSSSNGEDNAASAFSDITNQVRDYLDSEDLITAHKVEQHYGESVEVSICLDGLNKEWMNYTAKLIFLEDEKAIQGKAAIDAYVVMVKDHIKKMYADEGYPDISVTVRAYADDGEFEETLLWIKDDEIMFDSIQTLVDIMQEQFQEQYGDILGE